MTTWLLQPVFGNIRTEQEEAASLDGASHLTIFLTIVLPMMKGGLAAAGTLVFILCMNEYLFSAYLATDHAMTLTPWIAGQLSIKEGQVASADEDIAHFSAASVLLILPLLAFGGFVRRVLSRMCQPEPLKRPVSLTRPGIVAPGFFLVFGPQRDYMRTIEFRPVGLAPRFVF